MHRRGWYAWPKERKGQGDGRMNLAERESNCQKDPHVTSFPASFYVLLPVPPRLLFVLVILSHARGIGTPRKLPLLLFRRTNSSPLYSLHKFHSIYIALYIRQVSVPLLKYGTLRGIISRVSSEVVNLIIIAIWTERNDLPFENSCELERIE